jgi:hypothetical protein
MADSCDNEKIRKTTYAKRVDSAIAIEFFLLYLNQYFALKALYCFNYL